MRKSNFSVASLVVIGLALGLTGCTGQSLNFAAMFPRNEMETDLNAVQEVVPVWQEAEGPGVDNQAVTRGFGGQIYFITQQNSLPSEVNGHVRIYLFDDKGPNGDPAEPIHYFDFPPEAWKLHQIQTKLGPAYTVFVPYTRPGYQLAECALRIRYKPLNGPAIFSQLVSLTLAGSKPDDAIANDDDGRIIRSVGQNNESTAPRQTGLRKIDRISAERSARQQERVESADYQVSETEESSNNSIRFAEFEEGEPGTVQEFSDVDEAAAPGSDPGRIRERPKRESGVSSYTIPLK